MIRKNLLAAAITVALSSAVVGLHTVPAFAEDNVVDNNTSVMQQTRNAKPAESAEQLSKDLVKVSEDALISMEDVYGARLAIFNGSPEQAQLFADAAVSRIGAAVKDAEKFAVDIKAPDTADRYVPYSSNLTVLDSYDVQIPSAKNTIHSNRHHQRRIQANTRKQIKLDEVDVALSTRLIPVKFAQAQIVQAAKLISDGKYYEANLALKALDDATVLHSFAVDMTPKSGSNAAADANG